MESDYISTLYNAFIVLTESNTMLFNRITQLEERINSINIQPFVPYGGNINFSYTQYCSTIGR